MRPNAALHDPTPEYILGLFAELRSLGRSRKDVCKRIGVPYRTMGDYVNRLCPTDAPYTVQFAIESELEWERGNRPVTNFTKKLDNGENRPHNG